MKAAQYVDIPAWALQDAPSARSFFESIALAGLEDKAIRLRAADQKALLGAVVFGKQQITVLPEGEVKVTRSVCFGTMRESSTYCLQDIERAIAAGQRLML